ARNLVAMPALMQAALDCTAPISMVLDENGFVSHLNSTAQKLFKLSLENVKGLRFSDIFENLAEESWTLASTKMSQETSQATSASQGKHSPFSTTELLNKLRIGQSFIDSSGSTLATSSEITPIYSQQGKFMGNIIGFNADRN
ncbi:MAG: PAS domain-containing protein, partial [Cyanobacteria bacterium J06632_3]